MAVKYQSVEKLVAAYNAETDGSRGFFESIGLWKGPISIGSAEETMEKMIKDAEGRLPRKFGKGKLFDAEDMGSKYGPANFVLEHEEDILHYAPKMKEKVKGLAEKAVQGYVQQGHNWHPRIETHVLIGEYLNPARDISKRHDIGQSYVAELARSLIRTGVEINYREKATHMLGMEPWDDDLEGYMSDREILSLAREFGLEHEIQSFEQRARGKLVEQFDLDVPEINTLESRADELAIGRSPHSSQSGVAEAITALTRKINGDQT